MNTNIKSGAALAALSAMPQAEFVGHLGDIFEHSPWIAERRGKDRDTYLWLRELGKLSPLVHLQQTEADWDRHWSFTKANNAKGAIKMDNVVEALEQSGADE